MSESSNPQAALRRLNSLFVGEYEEVEKSYHWLRTVTYWSSLIVIILIGFAVFSTAGSGWEGHLIYWSLFLNYLSIYKWFYRKTYEWERQ